MLRRRDLTAFAINSAIGAGIFGLPAALYAQSGVGSAVAMLVAAIVVGLITLCFAEVGSAFTETGGPYLYAQQTFGDVAGFEIGWLLWVTRIGGFAAVTNLFVNYLGYFVPSATSGPGRVLVICAQVGMFTAINFVGVRVAASVNNALTVAKLVPLTLFVVIGLFFVRAEPFQPPSPPTLSAIAGTVLLAIYPFSGFEAAVVLGGEVREPARTIPFSLLTALGIVTLVYVGVQIVCIGTLPGLATSARPVAEAAGTMLGPKAAAFMVFGALLSITGVAHAIMLSAARLPFAAAERGQLPARVAAVHPRFRTPYVSLVLTAACILAFTLATSFVSAATITVGLRVLIYMTTCAALPVRRRRAAPVANAFRVPGGDIVALLSILICAGLLALRPWSELRQLVIVAVIGFVLYVFVGRRRPAMASAVD